MKVIEILQEKIREIPVELKDCFIIAISNDNAIKLREEINNKGLNFPITFMGVDVVISGKNYIDLEVKRNYHYAMKVYCYESTKVRKYLNKLEELCKKYNIGIGGCGCCGSPYLTDLFVLSVDDICFDGKKLNYSLSTMIWYKELIKESTKLFPWAGDE